MTDVDDTPKAGTAEGPPAWFKFFPKDFLASARVQAMTDAEVGQYVRLLCYQWIEGGLPAELERLATLATAKPGRWTARTLEGVVDAFPASGDVRRNERLANVRDEAVAARSRRKSAGRKGGRPPKGERVRSNCESNASVRASASSSVSSRERVESEIVPARADRSLSAAGDQSLNPALYRLVERWEFLFERRWGSKPDIDRVERAILAEKLGKWGEQEVETRMANFLESGDAFHQQNRNLREFGRSWNTLDQVPSGTRRKTLDETLESIRVSGPGPVLRAAAGLTGREVAS